MRWFKHFSDMSEDVKVKRLIRKYGVAGYGLYCYIIERIVRRLETESPKPDLEETAADIADDLRMDTMNVEAIVKECVELGLFELDSVTGRVLAHKVYKFLQQSETRSVEIRKMITAYNKPSQTVLDKCDRTEQNRTEQNRYKTRTEDGAQQQQNTQSQKHFKKPTLDDIRAYCTERRNSISAEKFLDYYEANGWRVGRNPMKDWRAAVRTWERNGLDKAPPKDTINGYKAQDAECPVCGGKIIGTLTTCMKCGYTKGDDTKDPENQAFYKANLERSKVKA